MTTIQQATHMNSDACFTRGALTIADIELYLNKEPET